MADLSGARRNYFRRMLKRLFSKAAAREDATAYSVRYEEPLSDARTPMADLLASC